MIRIISYKNRKLGQVQAWVQLAVLPGSVTGKAGRGWERHPACTQFLSRANPPHSDIISDSRQSVQISLIFSTSMTNEIIDLGRSLFILIHSKLLPMNFLNDEVSEWDDGGCTLSHLNVFRVIQM